MPSAILSRLLQALLVVLAMTVVVFVGVNVVGNPIDILISPEASQEQRLAVIRDFGLDLPLWQQYLIFLQNLIGGDLGRSYVYHAPALNIVMERFPATLELAVVSTLFAVAVGIPLGLLAGFRPNAWWSQGLMVGSILGFSIPTFWIGVILIMVFSVYLGWLPSIGRGQTVEFLGIRWSIVTLDGWAHLVMPAFTLALFKLSLIMRLTCAGVIEAFPMDFVRFARAKGLKTTRIIFVHVLKFIAVPIITVIGVQFVSAIAFSVVTESIFAWPGAGKLLIDSIRVLDRPVIVSFLFLVSLLFVLVNLAVDIAYAILDPRVRIEANP